MIDLPFIRSLFKKVQPPEIHIQREPDMIVVHGMVTEADMKRIEALIAESNKRLLADTGAKLR